MGARSSCMASPRESDASAVPAAAAAESKTQTAAAVDDKGTTGAGADGAVATKPKADAEVATFAAGCFWSVELVFQRVPGVTATAVGYTQGKVANPSYEMVCTGRTGHAEAVQLSFDPAVVSYGRLLEVFWGKHDPTQLNRQGNDWGTQYRSGIYYHSEEQRKIADESKQKQQSKYRKPIATEILPAVEFYKAEIYHQRYLEKGGQCAAKGSTDKIRCYG